MNKELSTESYYNSKENYSLIIMDYFNQFNQNFICMNCYTYTPLDIIHALGMDNQIVTSNSYPIIASKRRYFSYH